MRVVVVGLLFSLTLSAGDREPFSDCIRQWRGAQQAEREAGSAHASRELRRILAPLLRAMEDEDPEVRRRARDAILALVPGELRKQQQVDSQAVQQIRLVNGQILQVQGGQLRAAARLMRNAQKAQAQLQRANWGNRKFWNGQRILVAPRQPAADEVRKRLGVHARTARAARPYQGGVLVTRVEVGSRAAKLGLVANDVIVEVDGEAVKSPGELAALVAKRPDWSRASVTILRRNRVVRLPIVR